MKHLKRILIILVFIATANLAVPSVWADNLIGSWKACDGRVVTFSFEDGQYVGRYTELAGLGTYHFKPNEIGYRAFESSDGTFIGQVKWRSTDGTHQWRPNTIRITGNTYQDTGSDDCSKRMSRVRAPAPPANDLSGSWKACDGRVVTFSFEDGQYVGRYTELAGLGAYHFKPNEIGYRAVKNPDGTFVGQVKWRSTDGTYQWRPNTIRINRNTYQDSGSDDCSKQMSRMNVPAPPKNDLVGSWKACDGRVVTFSFEDGQYVGRYTELAGLGAYHFKPDEIGYRAVKNPDGTFVGQIKWRSTDSTFEWRPNTIRIKGNQYADSGSDNCSRQMTRQ